MNKYFIIHYNGNKNEDGNMEQLLEWMEIIKDVWQHRKVRHSIKDILLIVLFATLANADTWEQSADFALWNEDYLRQHIKLKNGIPSHDTIQRVMWMGKSCVPIKGKVENHAILF